ncbi:hypothetical protein AAY473_038746 [Plecturocebus cupreus]
MADDDVLFEDVYELCEVIGNPLHPGVFIDVYLELLPGRGLGVLSDPLRPTSLGWSAVAQSRLTTATASKVQAILLPQPPD